MSCGNVPLSLMLNGDGNAGLDLMTDENMGKMVQNGGDGNTAIREEERNGVVVRDYEKETRMKKYKEERRKQLDQVAARVGATATTTATTTGRENRRLQGQVSFLYFKNKINNFFCRNAIYLLRFNLILLDAKFTTSFYISSKKHNPKSFHCFRLCSRGW